MTGLTGVRTWGRVYQMVPGRVLSGAADRRRPGLVMGRKGERYAVVAYRPRSQSRRFSVKAETFILPP